MEIEQDKLITINLVDYNKPEIVHELTFRRNIQLEEFLHLASSALSTS